MAKETTDRTNYADLFEMLRSGIDGLAEKASALPGVGGMVGALFGATTERATRDLNISSTTADEREPSPMGTTTASPSTAEISTSARSKEELYQEAVHALSPVITPGIASAAVQAVSQLSRAYETMQHANRGDAVSAAATVVVSPVQVEKTGP